MEGNIKETDKELWTEMRRYQMRHPVISHEEKSLTEMIGEAFVDGAEYGRSNPKPQPIKLHSQRMEGFKEGSGKWTSEIYTEEEDWLLTFSNGVRRIVKRRYTEFRHDINNLNNKTVLDWHWVDYPYCENGVELVNVARI